MSKTLINRILPPLASPETEWEKAIEESLLNFSQAVSERIERISFIRIKSIVTDYTISPSSNEFGILNLIVADATNGNINISFPPAKLLDAVVFIIKKTDSSGNTVTIAPNDSETIDCDSSFVISDSHTTYNVSSDGDNLLIW